MQQGLVEAAKLPFGRIFQEAVHASWTALTRSRVVVGIAIIAGLVVALAVNAQQWTAQDSAQGLVTLARIVDIVFGYFALAAAVRLINPEFRMTIAEVIGVVVYSLGVGLISGISLLFAIVPVFYIYTKIGLAPYLRLLGDFNTNAMEMAWVITNGYFWQSLGFLIGLTAIEMLVGFIATFFAAGFLVLSRVTAFVTFPMVCGMLLYAIFVRMTGYTFLANALLREHERRQELRYVV